MELDEEKAKKLKKLEKKKILNNRKQLILDKMKAPKPKKVNKNEAQIENGERLFD